MASKTFDLEQTANEISKEEYAAAVPRMRVDLVNAQYDLQSADFAVLINLVGDDRQGCEEIVDLLHEWMDGRYIRNRFFGEHSEAARQRPYFWRYWRELPPRGRVGLFFGDFAWRLIESRFRDQFDEASYALLLEHARRLYATLAADGMVIVNIWLHLPKRELKKRLKKAKKNRREEWRVTEVDWDILADYDRVLPICEEMVLRTTTDNAPWHVVESSDERYRNLTVARLILDAMAQGLARESAVGKSPGRASSNAADETDFRRDILNRADLSLCLDKDEYKRKLERLQARLNGLSIEAGKRGLSTVLVFEGWDAAGKGGVIRRISAAMSARDVRVIPIAGPTDEELAHHYLWRFWRQLPPAGRMLIFDRSWYGRVLVERVEGFASDEEWGRAYDEIVDFEAQLAEHGMLVRKFWLHIDPDEQLARFKAREQTPYKKYKLTEEDYRNRDKWDDYVIAVGEMVARTSTDQAPWVVVPANDKRWARIAVLEEVCGGLESLLER